MIAFSYNLGVLRPELRTAYPPATEAVKKLLDQNITQVTEIRRLGRGQSIGSRCDRFNAPPPQVSAASSSNQPFNAVNGGGSSDTHRPWHSKLRRGALNLSHLGPLDCPLPNLQMNSGCRSIACGVAH